jgi:hypothetical protein
MAGEVDLVLEPLMNLLEGSLQRYAQQCEKTVLKYILKVGGTNPILSINNVYFQ